MPAPRKRFSELGRPLPCGVVIPPDLAVFLYREKRTGRYRDETEALCAIVREWAKTQPAVNWPALVKELMAEQEAEAGAEDGGASRAG